MFLKKRLTLLVAGGCVFAQVRADVPSVRYRKPDLPSFLQSMEFQTVQMQVFPREVSGMVPDVVSDLSWNPAFLTDLSQKTVYADFLSQESSPLFATQGIGLSPGNTRTSTGDMVISNWYTQTSIRSVQTVPLYNFGILLPIHPRLNVALFNRSVFDYGPFLQGYDYYSNAELSWARTDKSNLTPQRLEVESNQQTVLGNRLELDVSYRLSEKWDAGLRFGHMVLDRHGDMNDDRWAFYPHSSYGLLEDESLKIRGHHLEAGLGLMFRPDSSTRFGVYGGFLAGSGSETSDSQDTSRTWSETDVDPKFYSKNYSFIRSRQAYDEDGTRPEFALTFEKRFSGKWTLRTFLSGSWSDVDITGNLAGSDTAALDQTYKYYENGSEHIRRQQGHGSHLSGLTGDGKEKSSLWKGFASAAYAPAGGWSLFGGVYIQHYTLQQEMGETAFYHSHRWDQYTLYNPETNRDAAYQEREYSMKSEYSRWSLYLPVGLRVKVVRGFSVLLGTGVSFTLIDQNAEGERLYPVITSQKWRNESLVVNDREIDRYEVFRSDPAKVLNRQWGRYFGLAYQHPCGANVYLKFADDVANMSNWAFGFEMDW